MLAFMTQRRYLLWQIWDLLDQYARARQWWAVHEYGVSMSNIHGEPPKDWARPTVDGWRAPMPIGRIEQDYDGWSEWHDHPFGHHMDDATGWRECWYCGSMHPDDLLAAIEAQGWGPHVNYDAPPGLGVGEDYFAWLREQTGQPGIRLSEADWKYGFPHKFYVEGLLNPQAGQPVCSIGYSHEESLDESKHMVHPADATRRAKFYTEHLADATDFERLGRRLSEYIPNIIWERDADGRIKWVGRRGEGVR